MIHKPGVEALLGSALESLQKEILPSIDKDSKMALLLIINSLKMVSREMSFLEQNEMAELSRLTEILGETGSLEVLNQRLAKKIATAEISLDDPQLGDHLIKTTQESLQIDQPDYVSY